jgi:hypothetical protein
LGEGAGGEGNRTLLGKGERRGENADCVSRMNESQLE